MTPETADPAAWAATAERRRELEKAGWTVRLARDTPLLRTGPTWAAERGESSLYGSDLDELLLRAYLKSIPKTLPRKEPSNV